jgi:hypothetical protein
MKIYDVSEKEFKIMVLKLFTKVSTAMEEQTKNVNNEKV